MKNISAGNNSLRFLHIYVTWILIISPSLQSLGSYICETFLNMRSVILFHIKLKVPINKASNSHMKMKLVIEHNLQTEGQALLESRCKLLWIDTGYVYLPLRSYCTGISIFPEKSISIKLRLGEQAGVSHALRANLAQLSLENEDSGAEKEAWCQVRNAGHSSRGLKFGFQDPNQATHNYLNLQLRGIVFCLLQEWTHVIYIHMETHTYHK